MVCSSQGEVGRKLILRGHVRGILRGPGKKALGAERVRENRLAV